MYEKGLGVVKNYVRAYYWRSLAATTGKQEYLSSLDALSSLMTPEEIAAAQKLNENQPKVTFASDGYLGTVSMGRGACSMFSEGMADSSTYTFRPDATADQMVYDIVYYSGLRPNFQVRAASNVPNAAAIVEGTERLVLYNPSFMRQVESSTGTDWAAYSIMAHEIGHHLQGHTLEASGSRPPLELEADEFSGFIMARMDGALQEAQVAMGRFASEAATATHPGKAQRLQAIKTGWERGRATRSEVAPMPPKVSDRQPQVEAPRGQVPPPMPVPQGRVASACMTQVGACPMVMPVPVGSPCYCNFGIYGSYVGIAQ